MNRLNVFTAGFYLFFVLILMQNTIALGVVATGLSTPTSFIYTLKYVVLVGLIGCLIATNYKSIAVYSLNKTETIALMIVVLVIGMAALRGGGLGYQAEAMRFFLEPVLIFLVASLAAPFKRDTQLAGFVMTISLIYTVLGLAYLLIDRQVLVEGGMSLLLQEKLGEFGRGDAFYNGLPINFYYFHIGGETTNRVFGSSFDPLASAFLGGTLFLFLCEIRRRKMIAGAGILSALVFMLVVLTLTRSIIIGLGVILIASIVNKRGIAALPIWPVLLVGAVSAAYLFTHLDVVIASLDPSSWGHLMPYLKMDLKTGIMGSSLEAGAVRGSESLYLTIFLECGLGGFLIYLVWFTQLYRNIRACYDRPFARPCLECMFVYLFASLTTEHWFAFSSCALFWFLLGNSMAGFESQQFSPAFNFPQS